MILGDEHKEEHQSYSVGSPDLQENAKQKVKE
jgi:hypothetical protein